MSKMDCFFVYISRGGFPGLLFMIILIQLGLPVIRHLFMIVISAAIIRKAPIRSRRMGSITEDTGIMLKIMIITALQQSIPMLHLRHGARKGNSVLNSMIPPDYW